MGIEIEKKFLTKEIPFDLSSFPCHEIEQGYLNVHPAVRIRKEDDDYYMTYKAVKENYDGIGKTEYNMELDRQSYEHLRTKVDGNIITKKRYIIPINQDGFDSDYLDNNPSLKKAIEDGSAKIELDVFEGVFKGRILAEIEFPSEDAAAHYKMADWFLEDVTGDTRYSNSQMSREKV